MGGGTNRLFYLQYDDKHLFVQNVNLTGGRPPDTAPTWGTFSGASGGAVYNYRGVFVATNSVISGNTGQSGGGVAQYAGGYAEFTHVVFEYNIARGEGGGMWCGTTNCTLKNCTFRNNRATSSGHVWYGGGGLFAGNRGFLVIKGTQFVDNDAGTNTGNHIKTLRYDGHAPVIYIINSVFFDSGDGNEFGGNGGCTGTHGYCVPSSCDLAPAQCAAAGLRNHACVNRPTTNTGIDCYLLPSAPGPARLRTDGSDAIEMTLTPPAEHGDSPVTEYAITARKGCNGATGTGSIGHGSLFCDMDTAGGRWSLYLVNGNDAQHKPTLRLGSNATGAPW